MQTRTKTDAVDAAVLAPFAQRMPFTPWQRPDDLAALAIRACARHLAALNKLHTQTKNQLHAAQQTTTTPDFLIASRHQSIAHFDAQIEYLRRQVLDLIRRMNRSGNPSSCSSAPPVSPPPVPSSSSASGWSYPTTCAPSSGAPWPASIHASTRPAPARAKSPTCPRPGTVTCGSPSICPLSAPLAMTPIRAFYR